jgi:transmembrane sensor
LNGVLLACEALDPDALEALRAWIAADPARMARARSLGALESAVRQDVDVMLPDRHLLVLHALRTHGSDPVLTPEEQERLDAAQPALARLFERYPALRALPERIAEDARVFAACWAEVDDDSGTHRQDRPPVARRGAGRPLWRIGVALSLTAFLAVAVLLLRRDRGLVAVTAQAANVVTLADGTTVHLARGAVLRYRPGMRSGPRRVRLSGDAYFDVMPAASPFQVQTAAARIAVLGTVFGVRASQAATEVTLVEGALAVQGNGSVVRLGPGEQSRVARGAAPSPPTPVEVSRALVWSGLFVFRNTPLGEALAQLAERHGVSLTTTDALRTQQVTGTFEADRPLPEVLDAVALTLGVRVVRTENGYRLG